MLSAARVIKTPEETRYPSVRAVSLPMSIMAYTISQLGIGTTWAAVEKSVAHFMIDHDVDPSAGQPHAIWRRL